MSDTYIRYLLELLPVVPASVFAFLPVRKKLNRPAGLVLALAAVLGVPWLCIHYRLPSASVLLVTLLMFFPIYLTSVNYNWEKLLFCFATAIMLCIFSSMYTNYLMAPYELDTLLTFSPASSIVCLGLTVLVGLLFSYSLAVQLPYLLTLPGLDRFWAWLSLVPITLSIMFRWLVPPDLRSVLEGRTRIVALVLFPLFPLVLLLVFDMFSRISRNLSDRSRLQQENDILHMESKHYEALRRYMDETKVLRHDFRQHMRVIGELAAAGDTERLQAYLQELEAAPRTEPGRYCVNRAADALCAWYTARAKEQATRIAWQMDLPERIPLPDSEFCAMLGNLLDNSLQAVSALDEDKRTVTVICRMLSDKMMGLSVENPYLGTVRFGADGLPVRSRRDHGLGLASVASTVKRYHGSINIRPEGGIFCVDILLYF